jgi:cell division protein FtsW (lipid II flippase)
VIELRLIRVADLWLILAVALLVPVGVLTMQWAGPGLGEAPDAEVMRQLAFVVLGAAAMLALSRVDYHLLRNGAVPIYLLGLALLVVVLAIGEREFGARRWIGLAGFTVQPSEFAKLATIVAAAAIAAERPATVRAVLASGAVFALTVALVVLEPDLGTTIVLAVAWVAIIAAWGVPWRLLGTFGLVGLAVLPIAFAVAVPDYQRERLAVFFEPDRDPLGTGFTSQRVELALGSGGFTGRGFDADSSALDGITARTSDFVFAQIGEVTGLLGGALLLALFAVIAWRGYRAAAIVPDDFGRLVAVGLTTLIVTQATIHVAVNLRVFPTTGLPLPFVSQGGSAMLAMFFAVGVIESIAAHRPATAEERWTGQRWH